MMQYNAACFNYQLVCCTEATIKCIALETKSTLEACIGLVLVQCTVREPHRVGVESCGNFDTVEPLILVALNFGVQVH